MQWHAGTSGYSYKEWKGVFYPDQIAATDMLGHYASRLGAVEINNTFYRMPRTSVVESWAAQVPDDFRFVIKASRRITHQHRLKEAGEATTYLADKVRILGAKLGAVLFQLPPNLRCDVERLSAFIELWPRELPAAFEFRHASWHDPTVYDCLKAAGVALCVSEDGEAELPGMVATTDWVYLRLRKPGYTDIELKRWLESAASSGASRGFAFFKHEDEGAGPALAARFLALATAQPEPVRARRAPRSTPPRRPRAARGNERKKA